MRSKAHRIGFRQRQAAPFRRVLGMALALLMMLASLPMDVTAAVIDRFTAPRVVSETTPDGAVFSNLYDDFGRVVRRSSPQGSRLVQIFIRGSNDCPSGIPGVAESDFIWMSREMRCNSSPQRNREGF